MALENWWEQVGTPTPPGGFLPSSPLPSLEAPAGDRRSDGGFNLNSNGGFSDNHPLASSAIQAGAPFITSLFGPKNPSEKATTEGAASLATTGKNLSGEGQANLAPIVKILRALVSGNPAEIAALTLPQRARVLDQYDTARQAIARTAPRGGGGAGASAQSFIDEGRDLAVTDANARNSAIGDLGNLASNQVNAGQQALAQALQIQNAQAARKAEANRSFGTQLGGVIQTVLPLILAAA